MFFHCHYIEGKSFLIVDYSIQCFDSVEWLLFLPFVLSILIMYVIGLPLGIGMYLFQNRNILYTAKIHGLVGFLYDPYTRGSEGWELYELIRKLLLTGFLLFFNGIIQSIIGIIISILALLNLSYFSPHSSNIVNILNTLSFTFTFLKYLVAIIMQLNPSGIERISIGYFLIILDIIFIIFSGISIILCMYLIHSYLKHTSKKEEKYTKEADLQAIHSWS